MHREGRKDRKGRKEMLSSAARLTVSTALAASFVVLSAYEPLPQDRGASGAWQKLL